MDHRAAFAPARLFFYDVLFGPFGCKSVSAYELEFAVLHARQSAA